MPCIITLTTHKIENKVIFIHMPFSEANVENSTIRFRWTNDKQEHTNDSNNYLMSTIGNNTLNSSQSVKNEIRKLYTPSRTFSWSPAPSVSLDEFWMIMWPPPEHIEYKLSRDAEARAGVAAPRHPTSGTTSAPDCPGSTEPPNCTKACGMLPTYGRCRLHWQAVDDPWRLGQLQCIVASTNVISCNRRADRHCCIGSILRWNSLLLKCDRLGYSRRS